MATFSDHAFAAQIEPHRRELHVHCYRMLGNFDEAEDLVQETLLRAWRRRETFAGGPSLRAWLYRIATNACLDALRASRRRPVLDATPSEVPWLQPYPDHLLDQSAPAELQPEELAVARETIALVFLTTIQRLPGRQRAVLILRDVLEWSAAETAEALGMSVPAANSALQRARATLGERPPSATTEPAPEELALLDRYIAAHERQDPDAFLAVVHDDVRVTMPPHPLSHTGVDELRAVVGRAFDRSRFGDWRLVPTRANRLPAAAAYLRRDGDTAFRAFKLDVLRVEDGRIIEFTTFGASCIPSFGLPEIL